MNTLYFSEKQVLITGASSGIGKEMAVQLSKAGAKLILISENETELNKVKTECQSFTSDVLSHTIDFSNASTLEYELKKLISQIQHIDFLILNAGISQRALSSETSIEVHKMIMQVNFEAHVLLTSLVLPKMISAGKGHIAVTSSISGLFGFPLRSSYSASKHALEGYFESLMLENRQHNIFVTIANPGRVRTNISMNSLLGDGNRHGKLDSGQGNGISSEEAARQYLSAISKKKKHVLIGGKELLMVYIKRFIPRLFYRLAVRISPT